MAALDTKRERLMEEEWKWGTRPRQRRKCESCGKEFYCRSSEIKRGYGKYCSGKCYGEPKKSPWWTHPEEMERATEEVRIALREGRITKLPCLSCGSESVEAHHQDYLKPLEVMWFCKSHHISWHRMINGF